LAHRPRSRGGRIVTLTSDLGSAYAAQMKAALIAGGVLPGQIVDLAHDLRPHDIAEAAFLFREMARAFPSSSIHVAVVDPGVGGRRQAIAIETRAGPRLVGPDNGLLIPLARELGLVNTYRIDRSKVGRSNRVGTTFDGRDLFAPAAAVLAGGAPASTLGPSATPKSFDIPRATPTPQGARGRVLHVDRFGNIITNVPSGWVDPGVDDLRLSLGRGEPRRVPFVRSYESLPRKSLGALGSSFGFVELAVGGGRASDRLRAEVGARVALAWRPAPARGTANANSARPRKRR
jgi:S-adenosyl-L-methionine hydrolase (adenosine-forming)